jgi:hypothetical protein
MTRTAEQTSIRSAVQNRGTAPERVRLFRRDRFRSLLAELDEIEAPDPKQALFDYVYDTAVQAKTAEESDPETFRLRFEPMQDRLLESAIRGDMYQQLPKGQGMVSFDNTEGTKVFETCLKVMREQGLHQPDLLRPFIRNANLKNWSDVNVDSDLVIMRYETSGPVIAYLDPSKLSSLMDDARAVPGAADQVRSSLDAEGIRWGVADSKGRPITTLEVVGCMGRWAACVPVDEVVVALVQLLGVIELNKEHDESAWYDAARTASGLPQPMLPMIRGKKPRIVCRKADMESIRSWAQSLSGWHTNESTPLVMRDAVPDDILQ